MILAATVLRFYVFKASILEGRFGADLGLGIAFGPARPTQPARRELRGTPRAKKPYKNNVFLHFTLPRTAKLLKNHWFYKVFRVFAPKEGLAKNVCFLTSKFTFRSRIYI